MVADCRFLAIRMIEIVNDEGEIVEPQWLARAESVHRQLRPQLPQDYVAKMRRVYAGGARTVICSQSDAVMGIALYRVYENTSDGRKLYVDDLVTDAAQRSKGIGQALLRYLETKAKNLDCDSLCLDSGVQREQAHKFYFREGMTIFAYSFKKKLR